MDGTGRGASLAVAPRLGGLVCTLVLMIRLFLARLQVDRNNGGVPKGVITTASSCGCRIALEYARIDIRAEAGGQRLPFENLERPSTIGQPFGA